MPDVSAEVEMYDTLFKSTGTTWVPDYSNVGAVQEDKEKIAKVRQDILELTKQFPLYPGLGILK